VVKVAVSACALNAPASKNRLPIKQRIVVQADFFFMLGVFICVLI
jgi:hypothetical protein